jgi:hypothetical protein
MSQRVRLEPNPFLHERPDRLPAEQRRIRFFPIAERALQLVEDRDDPLGFDRREQRLDVESAPEPTDDAVERERSIMSVQLQAQGPSRRVADHVVELRGPQGFVPVNAARREKDAHGRTMLLQDRMSVLAEIVEAVVEDDSAGVPQLGRGFRKRSSSEMKR